MNKLIMSAEEAYDRAIENRNVKNKEIITRIRLALFKAIDEGETQFDFHERIPFDVIELLKAENYSISVHNDRNETVYTIKMKNNG